MADPQATPPSAPYPTQSQTGIQFQGSPADDLRKRNLAGDVSAKFEQWRNQRRPHDVNTFVNAAFARGEQYAEWLDNLSTLSTPLAPPHRIRLVVNRILPKLQARLAKLLKERVSPVVVPASTDRDDITDARATQKVLEYLWRKTDLEKKITQAILWSQIAGKGFLWVYWDPNKAVQVKDPATEQSTDVTDGDVCIEVGSPFELLVADQSIGSVEDQPEIMRVRYRDIDDIRARYGDLAKDVSPETNQAEIFHYERQIARLAGKSGGIPDAGSNGKGAPGEPTLVLIKELFTAPCAKYPKGRYVVVAGQSLLKEQDELPYTFGETEHPFPVVEFVDQLSVGQFWPTTLVEQMRPIQREYNLIRSKCAENFRLMSHPKVMVPVQAQIPEGAWTTEPGEMIRYTWIPGLPAPTPWVPPNVAADAWRSLELIKGEFDDVSNVYPASQGANSGAQSGFQVNLLQEATDSIHGPTIRQHQRAIEHLAYKMRRLAKIGYIVPRLISVAGKNYEPDVFEFSASQIDEHADIVVYAGSALSSSPAVKTQQILDLHNAGMFGDPKDPETNRKTLRMLGMGSMAEFEEITQRDEELARLETQEIEQGAPPPNPEYWHNHTIHYAIHTDALKSPEIRHWAPERRMALVAHVILHMKYLNPQYAIQVAQEFGLLQQLGPLLMPQQAQQPGSAPPSGPGQPAAAPPSPQGPAGPQGPVSAGPVGPVSSPIGNQPPAAAMAA